MFNAMVSFIIFNCLNMKIFHKDVVIKNVFKSLMFHFCVYLSVFMVRIMVRMIIDIGAIE